MSGSSPSFDGINILNFILEVVDCVMVGISVLQILFCVLVCLIVLIYVKDTFNLMWISRISLLFFTVLWNVGIIFGLDHFWSMLGRIQGKFKIN